MTSRTLFGKLAWASCLFIAATEIGRAQIAATISEIPAATPPVPGTYDTSQLLFSAVTGKPGGLNYYWDNATPNGSTFWTGTANPGGYILNSVAINTLGGGGANGTPNSGVTTSQPYWLRIYSVVTNATSTNATLLAYYITQSFSFSTEKDWLQVSGLNLPVQANAQYAYTFSRSTSSYENLGFTNGIPSSIGQMCEIANGGGSVNFGSGISGYSGTFDVGLSLPSGLTVAPVIASSANPIALGSTVTLTAGTVVGNTGSYTYQWQTDGGGNNGTLTNIPGATASTLSVNTTGMILGGRNYALVVTDSSSATVTSAPLPLDVTQTISGTFTDIGTAAPTAGSFDAVQLTSALTFQSAGGLNYYSDNSTPPGQTFTTGNNSKGYVMSSVAIQLAGGSSSGTTTAQGYDLFIFQISADGSTASLMVDVTNLNASFTYGDWIQWNFPVVTLNPNSVYAYTFHRRTTGYAGLSTSPGSSDAYTGGQIAAIPSAGGTVIYGNVGGLDGTFDVGLTPLGVAFIVNIPSANPNPAYALSPVKLADTVATPGNYTYKWLTDDGSGAVPPNYITISGATATNLTVIPKDLNPSGVDYSTNYYFVAADAFGNVATSSVVTLTVHPASAPQVTGPNLTNLVTFAGSAQTFSITEVGTLPITNQWQFNNGSGFVSLSQQTNTILTFSSLQTTNSGTYQITTTNLIGGTNSTTTTLTVLPIPATPVASSQKYYNAVYTNHPWAYWRLNETTDPNINDNPNAPVVKAEDYSGNGFLATYGNQVTVSNAGPSSLTPGFPGFDSGELAAGTENAVDQGYLTAPNLHLTGNTNITFMAWINPLYTPPSSGALLFNRGGPDNACGFGFAGGSSGDLGYTWDNNLPATYNWDSGLPVVVGQWNFVAYVITPTNTTVYLGNANGIVTNFLSASQVINNIGETWNGGTIRLGSDQNNFSRSFPGLIAEAALFTNSMTSSQVLQYFVTGIGATGLVPSVASTTINPSSASVYSGQNVILTANYNGTAPMSAQWQAGPDGSTWTNIPGANSSVAVVNPFVPTGGATIYYQLKVSNSLGSVTNAAVGVQFNDLPVYPPGLWTANFQETNNIGANQTIGGGVGHYVGRGALGSGMYWNVLPHILLVANPYNANNITNVTDFLDNGVTHSGITCVMNGGGSYNSLGSSLANSADVGNLLDQYFRAYNSGNALQFFGLPDGTYNLTCYAGSGMTSQGADNYGTTFVVHDSLHGNQTNSTFEPTFQTAALAEFVNFVTFTNVHVAGGTLNVDVDPNLIADPGATWGEIEGEQLQLVSYDPVVASFSGSPTNAFVGQAVTFANTSTGFVTNAVWSFGDGTSVTNLSNASVSHMYASLGSYTVSLVVSGPGGSPSSATHTSYIATSPSPKIGSAQVSGGKFILSGSNGPVGTQYRILTSTNLSLPLANWTPVLTNVFAPDGSYGYTNLAITNSANFFRLVSP